MEEKRKAADNNGELACEIASGSCILLVIR